MGERGETTYLSGNGHATRHEQIRVGGFGGHHAEFGGLDEGGEILNLLGGAGLVLVGGFVGVGAGHFGGGG